MGKLKLILKNGNEIFAEEGDTIYEVIKKNNLRGNFPVVLSTLNGKIYELADKVDEEGKLEVIDNSSS